MTTAPRKPTPQPDTRTKARQVDRIAAALEARLAGPSKAMRIVQTISTMKRKAG